jgi:hypothetical protein
MNTIVLFSSVGILLIICLLYFFEKTSHSNWLACIAFMLLPLNFSGIITISHICYVMMESSILWFQIIFPILWLLSVFLLWKRLRYFKKMQYETKINIISYCILLVMLACWFGITCKLAGYEKGATPTISTSWLYLFQLIVTGISTFAIILGTIWKSIVNKQRVLMIISICILIVFIAIQFDNV